MTTTKTRTTVTVDGDGPIQDAIRNNTDAIEKGINGDTSPTTITGAYGDQLRMFDGYEISLIELSLTGKARLWITDELHADIIANAKISDVVSIRVAIADREVELLANITARGVKTSPKGLVETITVKAATAYGDDGHELTDDDA